MRLVDSHCHIQADRFEDDADAVLAAAREAGLARILVPGWNRRSSEGAFAVAERHPELDLSVGVHPHDAADVDDAAWRWFVEAARDPRVVAIGETGLDFDRAFSPPDAQLHNLRRNLALARELGKPAILHCRSKVGARDAQDALLVELRAAGFADPARLTAFGGRPPAIIHSYSGPLDYGRAVVDLGLAISFSGLVFRAGEEASAAVVRLVPGDRILVETDSPFLAPPTAPRRRNEPGFVGITARWASEQRGEDPEAFGEALVGSYDLAFGAWRASGVHPSR